MLETTMFGAAERNLTHARDTSADPLSARQRRLVTRAPRQGQNQVMSTGREPTGANRRSAGARWLAPRLRQQLS